MWYLVMEWRLTKDVYDDLGDAQARMWGEWVKGMQSTVKALRQKVPVLHPDGHTLGRRQVCLAAQFVVLLLFCC